MGCSVNDCISRSPLSLEAGGTTDGKTVDQMSLAVRGSFAIS
jgi:hypothetical protein